MGITFPNLDIQQNVELKKSVPNLNRNNRVVRFCSHKYSLTELTALSRNIPEPMKTIYNLAYDKKLRKKQKEVISKGMF